MRLVCHVWTGEKWVRLRMPRRKRLPRRCVGTWADHAHVTSLDAEEASEEDEWGERMRPAGGRMGSAGWFHVCDASVSRFCGERGGEAIEAAICHYDNESDCTGRVPGWVLNAGRDVTFG